MSGAMIFLSCEKAFFSILNQLVADIFLSLMNHIPQKNVNPPCSLGFPERIATVFMSGRYLIVALNQSAVSSFQVLSALEQHPRGVHYLAVDRTQGSVKALRMNQS